MNDSNITLGIAPIAWTNDNMPELGQENTLSNVLVKWHWQDLWVQKLAINTQKNPIN